MSDHDTKHEEGAEGGEHKGHKSHGPPHAAHEEHQGCPEWLISFADNTALLMGFFVILLAMNMTPKTKQGTIGQGPGGTNDANMMDLVLSMRVAFNNPPDPRNPADAKLIAHINEKRDRDKTGRKDDPRGNFDKTTSLLDGTVNQFAAVIPFDSDSALLRDSALTSLKECATKLKGKNWIIEVRGHTSSLEAANDRRATILQPDEDPATPGSAAAILLPSRGKYALSYNRAVAVAEKLAEYGIEPRRLRIVGCSDNERQIARAGDERSHNTNQRVEVLSTQEAMKPDPNAVDPAKPAH